MGAQNPLDPDWDPSGSGGYMRKWAASTDLKGKVLAAPLPLPNCLQNTIKVCDLAIGRKTSAFAAKYAEVAPI